MSKSVTKIIDNWIAKSKQLKKEGISTDKQSARIGLLAALKRYGKVENIKVLVKEYTDGKGTIRKRAIALVEQRIYPRKQNIYIDTLIANPKGDIEEGFGDVLTILSKQLKTTYPDYAMQLKTNQKKVSNMYRAKLGMVPYRIDNEYVHSGMIRDIP